MKPSRIDAMICRQERLSHLTRQAIEEIQLRKLNTLLGREKARQGFYAHLPEKLDALSQLPTLPFTTEEDLAARGNSMVLVSQSEIQRILSDATSGTTGMPKRVFYTLEDCRATIELYKAGLGEFVFPGSRTLICMPFSGPYGLGELISTAIEELGATPIKAGVTLTYAQLKALMDGRQPDTFVGMPVPLLGILEVVGKGSLQRCLVSGDACPAAVTERIEAILGHPLYPHYGSREMGMAGAITCLAHEGMHLRENHIIAEIVDEEGDPLPPGAEGELVITTIGAQAQPLIRYRTGDYTRILPEACPCGSPTIRLGNVRRKGTAGRILELDERLFSLPGLIDYRAAENPPGLFVEARAVPGCDTDALKAAIRAILPAAKILPEPAVLSQMPMYLGKRYLQTASFP